MSLLFQQSKIVGSDLFPSNSRFSDALLVTDPFLGIQATMGVRLPTILGKAIDDVVKTLNEEVSLFPRFRVLSIPG